MPNVNDYLKTSKYCIKIFAESKNIYDQDGIFDLDEEGNPKKKKIQEIFKENPSPAQKLENYYQPKKRKIKKSKRLI